MLGSEEDMSGEKMDLTLIQYIKNELNKYANPQKAEFLPNFFRAFPGGYGEGDRFIGVTVPKQRRTARNFYKKISLAETEALLNDPVHEYRLTALFILTAKYEGAKTEAEKESVVSIYLNNIACVNNWDLVDSSAYKILGPYLREKEKKLLYQLAASGELWKQRIAIITTLFFIRNNQFKDTLNLAEILLLHEHDLIHKAVGWMLREVGKRDFEAEYQFLKKYYRKMPRTMLRYAIEKFSPELRKRFLRGEIRS